MIHIAKTLAVPTCNRLGNFLPTIVERFLTLFVDEPRKVAVMSFRVKTLVCVLAVWLWNLMSPDRIVNGIRELSPMLILLMR